MKTLEQHLNKKYDKQLLSDKSYKKQFQAINVCLKENHIACENKIDADCFRAELMYQSIVTKQKFEEVFFDTYVKMHDYWYDLTYVELKYQMNVEIEKLKVTLPHFSWQHKDIYLPSFDERFNMLYHTEIVLLDLKQYHAFIRTFHKEVYGNLYGSLPYEYNFTSAVLLAQDASGFVLYHKITHRFYLYQGGVYQACLSFDPKLRKDCDDKLLKEVAFNFLIEDEDALIEQILSTSLVSTKMKKKIESYKQKKAKRKDK